MAVLERLRSDHAPALLAFERENREYFAARVPDRGDAYFEEFDERHRELIEAQEAGEIHFHVLVAEGGEIVGRVNLVDVDAGAGSAELGYRLAEKATGRGFATRGVREVCRLAVEEYGRPGRSGEGRALARAGVRQVSGRRGRHPPGRPPRPSRDTNP